MKVSKWGNSLAIRIPKDVARALHLEEGDDVRVVPVDGAALGLQRTMTAAEAAEGLKAFRGRMPEQFRFDREDANAR